MSNGYTRTVGSITGSVRSIGDYVETNAPDDHISGPFLIDRVAAAYKGAYELLADSDPDRLTTTSGTLVESSSESLSLPSDLFRLRWIDVSIGGRWERLIRCDPGLADTPWESESGGDPWRYRLEGSLAYVDPPIAANTSTRFTYVPAPAHLSGSDQTLDGVAGLDELVTWTVVRDCKVRQDMDTTEADRTIERETRRVSRMSRNRDRGQAMRVQDPAGRGWVGRRGRRR